jgi:hypothetical protein
MLTTIKHSSIYQKSVSSETQSDSITHLHCEQTGRVKINDCVIYVGS